MIDKSNFPAVMFSAAARAEVSAVIRLLVRSHNGPGFGRTDRSQGLKHNSKLRVKYCPKRFPPGEEGLSEGSGTRPARRDGAGGEHHPFHKGMQ